MAKKKENRNRRVVQVHDDNDSLKESNRNFPEKDRETSEENIRMDIDDDDDEVQTCENMSTQKMDGLEQMKSIHQINQETEHLYTIIQKYKKQIPNEWSKIDNFKDNLWYSDPKQIFQELEDAQIQLKRAWGNHCINTNDDMRSTSATPHKKEHISLPNNKEFRDEVDGFLSSYMELMTCAFEEELDAIRQGRILQPSLHHAKKKELSKQLSQNINENNLSIKHKTLDESTTIDEDVDVEVLIDFLQSGSNIWTKEEQILFLSHKRSMNKLTKNISEIRGGENTMTKKVILTPHERRRQFFFGSQNKLS